MYELTIHEFGNEPYLIVAYGSGDVDTAESAILNHIGQKGRIRRYRFRFMIKDRQLKLKWLDEEGHEQIIVETPEW